MDPLGGPPGGGKGGNCWLILTQVPRHKAVPPVPRACLEEDGQRMIPNLGEKAWGPG